MNGCRLSSSFTVSGCLSVKVTALHFRIKNFYLFLFRFLSVALSWEQKSRMVFLFLFFFVIYPWVFWGSKMVWINSRTGRRQAVIFWVEKWPSSALPCLLRNSQSSLQGCSNIAVSQWTVVDGHQWFPIKDGLSDDALSVSDYKNALVIHNRLSTICTLRNLQHTVPIKIFFLLQSMVTSSVQRWMCSLNSISSSLYISPHTVSLTAVKSTHSPRGGPALKDSPTTLLDALIFRLLTRRGDAPNTVSSRLKKNVQMFWTM